MPKFGEGARLVPEQGRAKLMLDNEPEQPKKKEKKAAFIIDEEETLAQPVETKEDDPTREMVESLKAQAAKRKEEIMAASEAARVEFLRLGTSSNPDVANIAKRLIAGLDTLDKAASIGDGFNTVGGSLAADIQKAADNLPKLVEDVKRSEAEGKMMNYSVFSSASAYFRGPNWKDFAKTGKDEDWDRIAKQKLETRE